MRVVVTPDLEPEARRALLTALERAGVGISASAPSDVPWRRASIEEGLRGGDAGVEAIRYAPSPRRTRGATRA